MINKMGFLILIIYFPPLVSFSQDSYSIDEKYSIQQLQTDYKNIRTILETQHPRPYEFTPKEKFDLFLDSLYLTINHEMTEREFQFVVAQIIAKIHCAHTKLYPSKFLTEHFNDYFEAPSFKLFFSNEKAYLQDNFSSDTTIKLGAEILSINDISIKEITHNFLARIHHEGSNQTFIYNRMNTGMYGLFPGICDYPLIKSYKLEYINPNSSIKNHVILKTMPFDDYEKLIYKDKKQDLEFYIIDSLSTGVLSVSTFKIRGQTDTYFREYMEKTFEELKTKKIKNLIIDFRGNIGGWPINGTALLKYIMKAPFAFFDTTTHGYAELKELTPLDSNRFTGNLYILADGAGRSCTGMVLSFIKYYNLGLIIGEESCTSPSTNADNEDHVLPYSKLVFVCSRYIYEGPMRNSFIRGRGVMPDFEVNLSIDDILTGQDKHMKTALNMIKK